MSQYAQTFHFPANGTYRDTINKIKKTFLFFLKIPKDQQIFPCASISLKAEVKAAIDASKDFIQGLTITSAAQAARIYCFCSTFVWTFV